MYPSGDLSSERFPSFSSMDEWEKRPGTKLVTLMKLLQHLLSDDAVEPPTVIDGSIVYPSLPAGHSTSKTRKILVYYEYPMSTSTVESVMKLYGVVPFIINGAMKIKDRDNAVQRFIHSNDPDRRVLLFSSVGAAGLNLACADTVILFVSRQTLPSFPLQFTLLKDTAWSQQSVVQIIGRAHRYGQKRIVHVYRLLAVGTTDVIMASLAKDKDVMLQALVTKTKAISPSESNSQSRQ